MPDLALSAAPVRRRGPPSVAGVAWLFSAPAFLLLLATVLLPVLMVAAISLTDYRLGRLSLHVIGAGNYVRLLQDPYFWGALRNSAVYTAFVVPVSVFGALLLATLLNGLRRTRRLYEIVYFLPVTSTLTAMSIVWSYLLNGQIGPLGNLMAALGLPRLDFFADGNLALIGLAIIGIWHLIGFNLVLFLAGFTVISKELEEAAALDGIDGFCDRMRLVIWPMLAPTTLVVLVLSCIQSFQVFDTVAVLTNGGPYGATDMLLYKINTDTFQALKAGYGAALTMVYLALIAGFSALQVWLSNRGTKT